MSHHYGQMDKFRYHKAVGIDSISTNSNPLRRVMVNQGFEHHLIKNRAIFRNSQKLEEIREISLTIN